MDFKTALKILKISEKENINDELLKKKFKEKVLVDHPDKGGSYEKFIQLKDAYVFMKNHMQKDSKDEYYKECDEIISKLLINSLNELYNKSNKSSIEQCKYIVTEKNTPNKRQCKKKTSNNKEYCSIHYDIITRPEREKKRKELHDAFMNHPDPEYRQLAMMSEHFDRLDSIFRC